MTQKYWIVRSLAFGLMLGISGKAVAQMPHDEMQPSGAEQPTQFQRIDQPLWLKSAVTAGGIGLIGVELWWFLFSQSKSRKADTNQGIQEATITVDGGYEPNRIVVSVGQPVRLNFDRRDPSSCLEAVRIPDFHIAKDLPLNQVTAIEFTPTQPGEYPFTCGMNMFHGMIEVQGTKRLEATAQNLVSQRS
ncbi:cupredoxin domain-containing protein [Phormidesmis priestleyi ULC007]|uniref:Cupredoxin domain-containing protein n=1 Tax=Phormidesmis priestleyi ULC007 TaxID=1920490 RepID=A0A2T1DNG0_9CYAN|nr:cupredoxin domain-containing protein [Phormidesmis priestleyi]PSB22001.1 cupredoxin domain-containing protein [Phormidesmis priestleyi ULC007]PZO55031.1 MAG: cupredoxin domain-containing protein [Phormidesmis priestleyi]